MNSEDKNKNLKAMINPIIFFISFTIGLFVIFIILDLPENWLGFLGSFSGGILGTLGVIYVAHSQGEQQLNHMKIVENNERIRLKTEIQLNKIYTYHNILQSFDSDLANLNDTINTLHLLLPDGHFSDTTNDIDLSNEVLITLNRITNYNENHFHELISKVEILNEILRTDSELSLKDPRILDDYKRIDDTIRYLNEASKLAQTKRSPNEKASDITNLKVLIEDDYFSKTLEIKQWISEEKINFNSNLIVLMRRLS